MNRLLHGLLKEVLDEDTFNKFMIDFDKIKNEKIVSSGINSLEYISLLSELDERFSFTEEQIDSLETFEDLNILLEDCC